MVKYSPVDYCIFIFGGSSALAKALHVTHPAICQWRARGRIPNKRMIQILDQARMRGLDITAGDLIEGRELK